MRSLLIGLVCLGALAGGVGLAVVCVQNPFETTRLLNAASALYSTATSAVASEASGSAYANGRWSPPKDMPAQDNWTWHTKDGKTYEKVVIDKITASDVTITHSLGIAHISLDDLPAEVQDAIHYDPNNTTNPAAASSLTPIAAMLNNKLVDVRGQPIAAPGASVKYYAIYYSAASNPMCHTFTPKLVDWYRKFKPYHKNFELIFVSEDQNESEMYRHMDEMQMPWPAVRFSELPRTNGTFRGPDIQQFANTGIPDLVLVDSSGKVLADSYNGNMYLGPDSVIDYMDQNLGMN